MTKEKQREITAREALVEVTSTVLGKKTTERRKIKIRPFVTDPAHVGIKFGSTVQVGDSNYVKVDVFVSTPCYVEEMVDVFKDLSELGDKLMEFEMKRITGGRNGKK